MDICVLPTVKRAEINTMVDFTGPRRDGIGGHISMSWSAVTDFMRRAQMNVPSQPMPVLGQPMPGVRIPSTGLMDAASVPAPAIDPTPSNASQCWVEHSGLNLALRHANGGGARSRCSERYLDLIEAQAACDAVPWCGGVTRDSGLACSSGKLTFELRRADQEGEHPAATSWVRDNKGGCTPGTTRRHQKSRVLRSGLDNAPRSSRLIVPSRAAAPSRDGDRLGWLLMDKQRIAQERVLRGPPAYERFPNLAFRYRDWGPQTRHARGDAYPLYTLDTLRNLADHLFDSSTGWAVGPSEAAKVKPCELVYSTLRPTQKFLGQVHTHIRVPYLLFTDTADIAITHSSQTDKLLQATNLYHW